MQRTPDLNASGAVLDLVSRWLGLPSDPPFQRLVHRSPCSGGRMEVVHSCQYALAHDEKSLGPVLARLPPHWVSAWVGAPSADLCVYVSSGAESQGGPRGSTTHAPPTGLPFPPPRPRKIAIILCVCLCVCRYSSHNQIMPSVARPTF